MLTIVRGLVRPVITVMMVGAAIVMILGDIAIPEWYTALVIAAVSFWFGSRTTKKE